MLISNFLLFYFVSVCFLFELKLAKERVWVEKTELLCKIIIRVLQEFLIDQQTSRQTSNFIQLKGYKTVK